MRKAVFVFVCSISALFLKAQKPHADNVLKEAFELAAKENKKVFLMFDASWCAMCKKMDKAMNDPSVNDFFDKNYVSITLSVHEPKGKEHLENPGALAVLKKYYKPEGHSLPVWIFFDKTGNFLADSQIREGVNIGCPFSKEEIDYFIQVLKKTSSISNEEIQAVEKRFSKLPTVTITE